MIKKIILLLSFSIVSISAFTQMKFGVKGGVNYTFPTYKVSADSIDKPKTGGIGPVFGMFMDIEISDGLIFQAELLGSFRYYNSTVDDLYEDKDVSILRQDYGYHKLMYLEIPLLFKYNHRLNTGKYGRDNYLGFYAGPLLGLKLLSSYVGERTITYEGYGQTSVNASKDDLESDIEYKAFDLGISAGVMFEMEKGFRMGLRFNRSLAAVNSNDAFSINHNLLQFTMGWNFIEQ